LRPTDIDGEKMAVYFLCVLQAALSALLLPTDLYGRIPVDCQLAWNQDKWLTAYDVQNTVDCHISWSRDKWLKAHDRRGKLFGQLLQQYNLIGMSRAELEKLLGSPDDSTGRYRIEGACTFGIVLHPEYETDLIKRWRFESWGFHGNTQYEPEAWVDTNVLFDESSPLVPFKPLKK